MRASEILSEDIGELLGLKVEDEPRVTYKISGRQYLPNAAVIYKWKGASWVVDSYENANTSLKNTFRMNSLAPKHLRGALTNEWRMSKQMAPLAFNLKGKPFLDARGKPLEAGSTIPRGQGRPAPVTDRRLSVSFSDRPVLSRPGTTGGRIEPSLIRDPDLIKPTSGGTLRPGTPPVSVERENIKWGKLVGKLGRSLAKSFEVIFASAGYVKLMTDWNLYYQGRFVPVDMKDFTTPCEDSNYRASLDPIIDDNFANRSRIKMKYENVGIIRKSFNSEQEEETFASEFFAGAFKDPKKALELFTQMSQSMATDVYTFGIRTREVITESIAAVPVVVIVFIASAIFTALFAGATGGMGILAAILVAMLTIGTAIVFEKFARWLLKEKFAVYPWIADNLFVPIVMNHMTNDDTIETICSQQSIGQQLSPIGNWLHDNIPAVNETQDFDPLSSHLSEDISAFDASAITELVGNIDTRAKMELGNMFRNALEKFGIEAENDPKLAPEWDKIKTAAGGGW